MSAIALPIAGTDDSTRLSVDPFQCDEGLACPINKGRAARSRGRGIPQRSEDMPRKPLDRISRPGRMMGLELTPALEQINLHLLVICSAGLHLYFSRPRKYSWQAERAGSLSGPETVRD